ncbi:MAG TPA: hypothetical protein VF459_18940 [Caulobacteraceae bacterium]
MRVFALIAARVAGETAPAAPRTSAPATMQTQLVEIGKELKTYGKAGGLQFP